MKRSLKASETGIPRAKQAFRRTGWTQEYLAAEVGLETRQSIWKFFSGRPIERHLFIEICFKLNLDWEEIADLSEDELGSAEVGSGSSQSEVEIWVQQVRLQIQSQMQTKYGFLQTSLDVSQPLPLEQLYTEVQVLQYLNSQRWLEVSDLKDSRQFERFRLSLLSQATVPALEVAAASPKLMILGKPGSGKTTFLQYLALQCSQGSFQPERIPLFIQLRDLTDGISSLESYITQEWSTCGLTPEQVEQLLRQGKALILLDGLDEIPQAEASVLLRQIQKFAETFYLNQLIITCRIAAQEYQFQGFTYVEIADFDQQQIETFARKWFLAMNAGSETIGGTKANQFLEQLQRPENQPIRELVVTPILLHLTCLVFQGKATFPTRRARLYQAGLDILLVRWDSSRGIQRDQIYQSLSLPLKLKLLSQIASTFFEQGKYFFEKDEVLSVIRNQLLSFPEGISFNLTSALNGSHHAHHSELTSIVPQPVQVVADPETLWLMSEAILRSISLQHGLLVERARDVYSFSHLTFQEYLTARHFVSRSQIDPIQPLQQLAQHSTDPAWREVILLTASLLTNAETFLGQMKQYINTLIENETNLKTLLQTIQQKAESVVAPYQKAAIRAFYLTLFQDRNLNLALALDSSMNQELAPELALDLALSRAFHMGQSLEETASLKSLLSLRLALDLERTFPLQPGFLAALQELKALFPDPAQGKDAIQQWWQQHRQQWINQFRQFLIQWRSIGHQWGLTSSQQQRLQDYYQGNLFLVECLNLEGMINPAMRAEFEATLLTVEQPIELTTHLVTS